MTDHSSDTDLLEFDSATDSFHQDVVLGLSGESKSLPCKYFYDKRGSQLFDAICELDEYYLTRTESLIMRTFAAEMAEQIGTGVMLIEYGSGSSTKTRILLEHLIDPVAYVPVDISKEHLQGSADRLAKRFPDIEVLPICADFTQPFRLPVSSHPATHNAVYFPGSTIGNFQPAAAETMLRQIVDLCGCGGGLLIGIDLQKDPSVIEAAYNDRDRVTAEFNLNLLRRINRELDAEFPVDRFYHSAEYDPDRGRVELSLVSESEQVVRVGNKSFRFREGESIHTEFSHKYTIDGFAEMAARAGLTLRRHWTDPKQLFAVLHLVVDD